MICNFFYNFKSFHKSPCSFNPEAHNACLRGWQRITLNSNTTTITTAAQWDWKRYALKVPLEAFVSFAFIQQRIFSVY
ncbi:hypothetical protein FT673_13130 [Aeromonas hydrophila]|nr:hypothetical protein FT673_13130 [Aeromonas hydrophila]